MVCRTASRPVVACVVMPQGLDKPLQARHSRCHDKRISYRPEGKPRALHS